MPIRKKSKKNKTPVLQLKQQKLKIPASGSSTSTCTDSSDSDITGSSVKKVQSDKSEIQQDAHAHTPPGFLAYSCLNSMLYQWVLAGQNSCLCMAFDDCMVVCWCLIVLAILQSCRSMLFCRILFCTGILRHFNQWTTLSAFSLTTKKIFKDKMADHETVWF